jgi:hypothetical protein
MIEDRRVQDRWWRWEDVMGAWGYGPMENDHALGWLADQVESRLVAAIKGTLQAYLADPQGDEVKLIEAEAAAALLADLVSRYAEGKYSRIDVSYLARAERLWGLAIEAVNRIMENERWLAAC